MLPSNAFVVGPMLAALTFGAALPEPNPANVKARELVTTMTAYLGENYSGLWKAFNFTIGSYCYSLTGDDFNDHINSVKVENGYHCRLYQSGKCDKKSTDDIRGDLPAVPSKLDNKVSSFKCWEG